MMFANFDRKIWTCRADLKFYGVDMGTTMTVVDLDGQGSLWVHSPIKLSQEIKNKIDNLGRVHYVVAPNRWHHMFIGDFKAAYPTAKFYCAPGLETKRADFKFDEVIDSNKIYPWSSALQHKLVRGVPIFNEVVFFHVENKTLILTDLAFHICESRSFYTRQALRLLGVYGKFGMSWAEKIFYVRDKPAFKKSIEEILEWDIQKILVTHGSPVLKDGRRQFSESFL